jgi:hypothetical protein
MTPEKEQLYAKYCALPSDLQPGFMQEHGLEYGAEMWAATEQHKKHYNVKGGKKQQRHKILEGQNGECALCEELMPHSSRIYLDRQMAKIFCPACFLMINKLRKSVANGITAEHLAPFVPGLCPTLGPAPMAVAPVPAAPDQAPDT